MSSMRNDIRSIRIGEKLDTYESLAHAEQQAIERGYSDFTIVDVDAHHYENESWAEIIEYIEDPVIKQLAQSYQSKDGSRSALIPQTIGNQQNSGRILRNKLRFTEETDGSVPRDVEIVKRAMRMIGIDYTVVFPTPMLFLGLHPQANIEVAVARAYARWMTEKILPVDSSIKTMLYLPFNDPTESLRLIEEFSDKPGVVGFMVTSVRFRPVHHRAYMKVYKALEERNMPLGFHAAYSDRGDRSMEQLGNFISVHALGFPFYNMIHLSNWVISGLPERFPNLKVIWIESGLAWIPFLMQRLDHEYMMRTQEAPLLKKKPSDYMREFFYTVQPMERYHDPDVLKMTFKMINAETQLLYASDYPHWDFDLPSVIYDLPFLTEEAKRNILGGSACKLFNLEKSKKE